MNNIDSLLSSLSADSLGRLRWRVLREFGVLPGSRPARKLSDAQVVFCGLNLLLDQTAANIEPPPDFNPAFDDSRFANLQTGGADDGNS